MIVQREKLHDLEITKHVLKEDIIGPTCKKELVPILNQLVNEINSTEDYDILCSFIVEELKDSWRQHQLQQITFSLANIREKLIEHLPNLLHRKDHEKMKGMFI